MKRYKYQILAARDEECLAAKRGMVWVTGFTGLTKDSLENLGKEALREFWAAHQFLGNYSDDHFEVVFEELDSSLAPTPVSICQLPETPWAPWESKEVLFKEVVFELLRGIFPFWEDVWDFPWGEVDLQTLVDVRRHLCQVAGDNSVVSSFVIRESGSEWTAAVVSVYVGPYKSSETVFETLILSKGEVEKIVYTILLACAPLAWKSKKCANPSNSSKLLESLGVEIRVTKD